MIIQTSKGAWLDSSQRSSNIIWLLNSSAFSQRNIKSNTKFEPWELSMY